MSVHDEAYSGCVLSADPITRIHTYPPHSVSEPQLHIHVQSVERGVITYTCSV